MNTVRQRPKSPRLLITGAAISLLASPVTAQGTASRPASRTCVLDEAALMARSQLAVAMSSRFRQVRDAAQASFDADSRRLAADDQALTAGRSGMSEADRTRRSLDLSARHSALRLRGEQINRDLDSLDKELTRNVIRLALPTIRVVEAENACEMVVARSSLIDLRNPALDISERVVSIMNSAPARSK